MSAFEWTETTPKWSKPCPYRRHDGFDEATQTALVIERAGHDNGNWSWVVYVPHVTEWHILPGGDLPDDDAKRLAPIHLANQMRRLLEALS